MLNQGDLKSALRIDLAPALQPQTAPALFALLLEPQKGDVASRIRSWDLVVSSPAPYPCCHGSSWEPSLLSSVLSSLSPWDLPKSLLGLSWRCSFVIAVLFCVLVDGSKRHSVLSQQFCCSFVPLSCDPSPSPLRIQDGCHHGTEPGAENWLMESFPFSLVLVF